MGHTPEEIAKSVKTYVMVFVALLVLTGVTVGVAMVHLNIVMAVIVAMLVASIKGSLVACYFMHLIDEKKLIYWVLALTVFFFAVLMSIPVLDIETNTKLATGF